MKIEIDPSSDPVLKPTNRQRRKAIKGTRRWGSSWRKPRPRENFKIGKIRWTYADRNYLRERERKRERD